MLPSPPLTDPDVRITRIRFFTRKLRSGDIVLVDDLGWRQRVSRKHGPEARSRQIAVTTAPRKPFPPYPYELMVIPPDPSAVSRDAIVGAVPSDHPRQVGVLVPERAVQVSPIEPVGTALSVAVAPLSRTTRPEHSAGRCRPDSQ